MSQMRSSLLSDWPILEGQFPMTPSHGAGMLVSIFIALEIVKVIYFNEKRGRF